MGTQGRAHDGIGVGLAVLLIVLATAVLTLILAASTIDPGPPEATPEQLADMTLGAQRFLDAATEAGAVMKVDTESRTVWIAPLAWAASNRDLKEKMVTMNGQAVQSLAGPGTVTMRSYADDRELGTYGPTGAKIAH